MNVGSLRLFGNLTEVRQLVYESTLIAPATSVTISGLNGDVDNCYELIVFGVCGTGYSSWRLYLNGDSTATNYGAQSVYGRNSTLTASNITNNNYPIIDFNVGSGENSFSRTLINSKSGNIRTLFTNYISGISGTSILETGKFGWIWNNSVNNITSLVITASAADGIATGTRIELYKINSYMSQYPTLDATHVKATSVLSANPDYAAHWAMDPSTSLTGSNFQTEWISDGYVPSRFHVDLGSAKTIKRIYYENNHYIGSFTNDGVKTFTFWGSNSSSDFNDLTYANDGTWTQISTASGEFLEHISSDIADPHYILVSNNIPYQYYAFKFSDTHGGTDYLAVRRIELQIIA